MIIDPITILGLVAGALTTFSFVPQLVKAYKTKSVSDISIGMYSAMTFGIILWEIYAVIIHSIPLMVTNIVSFSFSVSILILRIIYGKQVAKD